MTAADSSIALLNVALQQAAAHHQSGRLQEAEELYRAILQVQPDHPDVNHNLGMLLGQTGRSATGLLHLKAALEADPTQGQYWLSYAEALLASGQAGEALTVIQTALQCGLDTPAALALRDTAEAASQDSIATGATEISNLSTQPQTSHASTSGTSPNELQRPGKTVAKNGKSLIKGKTSSNVRTLPQAERNQLVALFNAGRSAELESRAHLACKRYPDSGFAWKILVAALQKQGKDALSALQKAAKFLPDDAEIHYNLGVALKNIGQLDGAVASYRRALEITPDDAETHNNLGVDLKDLGRLDEAVACYRRALEIKPDFVEAHNNLGNALKDLGQLDSAVASYRRALEINPDYADAHSNLGNALQKLGQLDGALLSYRRALALKPDFAMAHYNLGNALQDLGQLDEALASYRRALEFKPDLAGAINNLLFTLNYHPDKSSEAIYAAYREFDQRFGLPYREKWRPHDNDRHPSRRLKVGYVSPDFRRQACQYFLEPLLSHHDKNWVEVYAYAELAREDEVTARYRGYADHWVPTRGMSDDTLSERIRADGIDILVELAGHTKGNRLQVLARKPAPVSLSWLGYGYTTGLTAIDYLLIDATSAPAGNEGLFSETPWRLETPCYAYRPAAGMGQVSPLPALTHGRITFGTLTRALRINHRTIRVWSEILKRVEGARLVIDSHNFQSVFMQDDLAAKFAAHGVTRERLEIGYHSPPWDVLRSLDIGLDCFPHNSGTTLFETLYMGIPFITLAGRPSVGLLGSSILEGAGHPEWIARSEDEYVEKAVALALDPVRLAILRGGLRHEMETGPLMDEAGFARKVEAAYREMWVEWCGNGQDGVNSEDALPSRTLQPQAERQGTSLTELQSAGKNAEKKGKHVKKGKSSSKSASSVKMLPQAERNQLVVLFNAGRHAELESRTRLACERYPDSGFAWKILVAALQMQGKDAFFALQKAAELLPDDAEIHYNLGVALKSLGQLDGAVESYRRVLEITPDDAETHNNLGVDLKDLGRLDEAMARYRRALAIKPGFVEAHNNLGNALKDLGQLDDAAACYRRALEIKPDYADAHSNLGNALQKLGQLDDALASYRRALEIKPDLTESFNNLLFTLNYHPDKNGEAIFEVYREYDERFGLPYREAWRDHGNNRETDRRLKVGYVSPDFRRQSCRHFLEPLLSHHDKNLVEVYAYAELTREDEVTARYRGYVDHWVPTLGMTDDALSERIRADGIDILVDLAGHTAKNRLSVFARKPAPVSLSWLGYGYTTGLTAIDYLLTDAASAPPGSEGLFSEIPWRLETPAYAYRPAEGMGSVSPLPVLTSGHITFGTLTRAVRINHRTIQVWSEILKRVEGARLVIDSGDFQSAAIQEALAAKFAAHGVVRDRLEIGCHSPPWDVLRSLDIGLDCFPHNSGTTLFETLYMGVPFVTLAGRPSVGRLGSTVLEGVGHPEWIARTEDEYVEMAVALASDLPKLAALRGGLRMEMETGLLMDEAGFTSKMETAYREMFGKWVRK